MSFDTFLERLKDVFTFILIYMRDSSFFFFFLFVLKKIQA
jgi:hypothetical protein